MLTALIQATGRKVGAWEADRTDKPFRCFCCEREVTLRRGGARAAHFAHKPPVTCEYGTGESEIHRRCKIELYEHLRRDPRVTKCEIERDLGAVRPDVSARIDGVPVAVEVQLSNLSIERIIRRTTEYWRRKIYVLWLPVYTESLAEGAAYNPKPWERWLHAVYFGRVYYWVKGLTVLPVHFRDYYVYTKGRTKDYARISRRFKVPVPGQAALLTRDFGRSQREAWDSRQFAVPPATLWIDSQPDWWR